MQSIRKLVRKPRVDDWSPLAKFYYADEALNAVANELDSFDGRRDPERCNQLVTKLRQAQDRLLHIISEMMIIVFPREADRACRDYRVKFPDEIVHDNLPGQLWFGAECLTAGSNIIDHEAESEAIRPMARALTRHLDSLRDLLKDQSLRDPTQYSDKIKSSLKLFDHLFAEFELNYVSAMVPVKSVKEYDCQLDVAVLFSETLERALRLGYITQEAIDDCDPNVMITVPRLAIVCGLLYFPDGALNVDGPAENLSDMFRPFHNLLTKIRNLLRVVTREELRAVELALCSGDSAVSSTVALQQCDAAGVEERPWADTFTICDFKQTTATVCSRSHIHPKKSSSTNAAQNSMPNINSVQSSTPNVDIDINSTNTNSHASNSPECDVNSSDTKPSSSSRPHSQSQLQSSSKTEVEVRSQTSYSNACLCSTVDAQSFSSCVCPRNSNSDNTATSTTIASSPLNAGVTDCLSVQLTRREATASSSLHHYNEESDENDSSANNSPSPSRIAEDSCAVARRILSPTESASSLCDLQPSNNDNYNAEKHLIVSISAAGVDKNVADQSHVSGNNNCGATNAHALRARFRSSADIVHRLFVCIAGVADQLQTNYPADVRKVLKMVLQPNDVVPVYEVPGETASQPVNEEETGVEVQEALPLPSFVGVRWVPDSDCEQCTACATAFTLVRRRHHCRNCGRIFCSRCSANSLPLPELGYDRKVRVCNLCFLYKINPFSPCQPIPMGNSSAATVQHQPPQIHSSRNQNQQHAHLDSTFHMPGDATYNTVTSSSATTHSTSQAS